MQLNTGGAAQPLPSERYSPNENEVVPAPPAMVQTMIPIPPAAVQPLLPPPPIQITQSKELLGLLRKYPIMWNGSIALKNDTANVQVSYQNWKLRNISCLFLCYSWFFSPIFVLTWTKCLSFGHWFKTQIIPTEKFSLSSTSYREVPVLRRERSTLFLTSDLDQWGSLREWDLNLTK